jgi:hypothetical protein
MVRIAILLYANSASTLGISLVYGNAGTSTYITIGISVKFEGASKNNFFSVVSFCDYCIKTKFMMGSKSSSKI